MFPSAPHGVLPGLEHYTFRPASSVAKSATPAAASVPEEEEPAKNTVGESVGEAMSEVRPPCGSPPLRAGPAPPPRRQEDPPCCWPPDRHSVRALKSIETRGRTELPRPNIP